MKPFNLEEAKAGNPVVYKDNTPVKFLTFDADNNLFPVVALVKTICGEVPRSFTKTGYHRPGDAEPSLHMVEKEHTAWCNFYSCGQSHTLYKTRQDADKSALPTRVARVKITYKEGQYDE